MVEGKWDEFFFGRFCSDTTAVIQSGGCSKLINIFKAIREAIPTNSIAIKDSDFDRINSSTVDISGFFYTDCHDCEMMVMASKHAFGRAMESLSITLTEEDIALLFDRLRPLSVLKWFCYSRPEMRPSFRGIDVCGLEVDIMCDICRLASLAIENTHEKGREVIIDLEELKAFYNSHTHFDYYEVVNGHDMIAMLLQHAKTICNQSCSRDEMRDALYRSFNLEDFSSTNIYRDIKAYESTLADGTAFFNDLQF